PPTDGCAQHEAPAPDLPLVPRGDPPRRRGPLHRRRDLPRDLLPQGRSSPVTDRTYAVAIAPRKDSRTWSQEEIRFSDLVEWAENPADHKECGNYLLGTLRGGRRTKNTIVSRSAVQLDADRATEETWNA